MNPHWWRLAVLQVFTLLLLIGTAGCTSQWRCSVPPTDEFEVGVLSGVIQTSRVAGTVYPVGADEWVAANEPAVYVWQHPNGEIVKVNVDVRTGRFAVTLPDGRYCFRASAKAFNAIIGRIEVRQSAPVRPVDIRLTVAN
ncbi:MAG TPA: hypothetical protein VF698_04450 [Thermoanaerobaculia bacterium]|jgi:hypothetical protein